ncbi:hypothetical protein DP149_05560 [Clostridium tetani]|nr:hypothetical protein [Clostridium tetani]KGI36984.1 hypothetical protein KY52_11760 [Clostridium tetani]KGI46337.1 hypothetical protein KY54_01690 [Clostridium tetani]KHO36447.1 hypothetical protein OR63_04940 [Clostridium tetani]KIG21054.1 hypothetical protein RS78_05505 [Clostridium tetani]RXI62866.1 hypothetical protein DP132_04370 [Clostridium tetani]
MANYKKYVDEIKKNYDIVIYEKNYREIILKEFEYSKFLQDYFQEYMDKENGLDLNWSTLMVLFIKASKEKNVTLVEKYHKELRKYKSNYYVEYVLGEINLMYYGDLFKAKDAFNNAIKLKGDDGDCYYNLGFIYYLLGIFEKFFEFYIKAIKYSDYTLNPENLKNKAISSILFYYELVEKDEGKLKELCNKDYKNMTNEEIIKTLKGETLNEK